MNDGRSAATSRSILSGSFRGPATPPDLGVRRLLRFGRGGDEVMAEADNRGLCLD